jgi:hypothetical protein
MKTFAYVIFGWVSFCAAMVILFWCLSVVRLFPLWRYLKQYEYQKWRELTSIGKFGPGLSNPLRVIPYLFGDKQTGDENLLRLKDSARVGVRYFLIWFATFAVSLIIGFGVIFLTAHL